MGVSPGILFNFINRVLDEITYRKHHLVIIDGCLIHPKKNDYLKHGTALLNSSQRNVLKIS